MAALPTRRLYLRLKRDVAVRDHRVRRLVAKLRKVCAWIADSDTPTCRGWAQAAILAEACYAALRDGDFVTESGEPKKLLGEFRALRSLELSFAKELGLTPASRRQLAASGKGTDLAGLLAAGPVDEDEDGGENDKSE
ncbi:MAG: hypothetical protein ACLQBA_07265 [Candidatus Binataceae bacterium]